MNKLTKENALLKKRVECMSGIIQYYSRLDKLNTQALEENEVKVEKWDKLIKAIQDSYDEDGERDVDFDIWDFLGDELGVEPSGIEPEPENGNETDPETDDSDF